MPAHPEHDDPKDDETTEEARRKAADEKDPQPGEHDPDFDPTIEYRGVPVDGRISDENS